MLYHCYLLNISNAHFSKLRKKESELLYPIDEDDETDFYNSGSDMTPLSSHSSKKIRSTINHSSNGNRLFGTDNHETDDSDGDSDDDDNVNDRKHSGVSGSGGVVAETGMENEDSDDEAEVPDW